MNHYQHFPGFVYERARLCAPSQTIEITVRPRRGSRPVCSGCHKPAPGYDHLSQRRFEFVPLWGCMVVLLYCMRRVDCRACGVRVEAVPWGIGKHQLTKAYMLFLAHWARKLSWQETAVSFRSTWDKVCQSVEYVVQWGIEHRQLGPIVAIGVDEIQYAKGHKYLTLVYQIEQQCTRLLWIGRERTVASFEQFFALIGEELAGQIEFVCSDMWQPYLTVIRERCSQAIHILDRFHIVWSQIPDAGVPDRTAVHAPAMDRPGADGGELRAVLHPDRRGIGQTDRVCLLGHVAALSDGDPRAVQPSHLAGDNYDEQRIASPETQAGARRR